jgi:hypothetical protein
MWKIQLKIVSVHIVPPQATQTNVEKTSRSVNEDTWSTILEIAGRLGISCGTCQQILREDLNMQHISTKFVLWLLTSEQKQWWFLAAKDMAVARSVLAHLILPLVISSCFWEWNCSYEGIIPGYSWYSGTIADCPTSDSKKSVLFMLPAVAETLDPLHKLWRGQQCPIMKVSIYLITGSVWKVVDIRSYVFCFDTAVRCNCNVNVARSSWETVCVKVKDFEYCWLGGVFVITHKHKIMFLWYFVWTYEKIKR